MRELTRAECAYMGEYLRLDKTLESSETEYYIDEPYRDSYNNISYQNSSTLQTYYVTAIDSNGNESFFSKPICSWRYSSVLPYTVKRAELGLESNYYIQEFLESVAVTSKDDKTFVQYPINYTKVGTPNTYSHTCDYEYQIVGTFLSGRISYYQENDEFPDAHVSSYDLKRVPLPEIPKENIIPTNIDTFVDADYHDSVIEITAQTEYPDSARILYDEASLFRRTDMELARMINKGMYVDVPPLEAIQTFLATDNPEYIVIREGSTIIVREATPEDFANKEQTVLENKEETIEPAKEINNSNFVEEQRKSTKKQVSEADKQTVEGTDYPVFADTAGRKYLALNMIHQNEEISLKAFPAYQNSDKLFDDLFYVWYQNPYIMGINPNECTYDYNNQLLKIEYNMRKSEAEKRQEAVYKKANEVIREIIKDSMSDEEKVMAIWNYIENNSEYHMEAYDYAVNGGADFYQRYPDCWNTYGILCEKSGVCQSYSYVFKLLASMSGLDALMVTGTMNHGGHAWNAVKIENRWYMIDVTNNAKALDGIYFWVCNASLEFIERNGFALDETFLAETNIFKLSEADNSKDWYQRNHYMPKDISECAQIWNTERKSRDSILLKFQLNTLEDKKSFWSSFKTEAKKLGATDDELSEWRIYEFSGIVIFRKV